MPGHSSPAASRASSGRSIEQHPAQPAVAKLLDPSHPLLHVDPAPPRAEGDSAKGNHAIVARVARLVEPRLETLEVLLNLGQPGAQAVVPAVGLAGELAKSREELDVGSGSG